MRFVIWNFSAFLFLLCAAVQLNDPDPMGWVLIYSLAAYLLHRQSTFHYYPRTSFGLLCLSLMGSVYLWPSSYDGITGNMDGQPNIEYARESMGLALIALSQIILLYVGKTSTKPKYKPT